MNMAKEIAEIRALSSAVCGSRYRLEILLAISDFQTFTATDVLRALWKSGDPPAQSIVSTELKRLRESGLVRQLTDSAGGHTKPLVAVESQVWSAVRMLVGDE